MTKADRTQIRLQAHNAGYEVLSHFVNADKPLRRERVLQRNLEKGATYSFEITAQMFEAMEKIGWVSRQSDPRDARVGYACLIPAGAQLVDDAVLTAESLCQEAYQAIFGEMTVTLEPTAASE
ncbi:hypothetical protein D3C76_1313300 [compost metagenome]